MNKIFIQVEVTRDPVITTLKNFEGKNISVVMFVGKITAPTKETTGENQVFFYTTDMFLYQENFHNVTPIFSAIATSKAGDKVVLKTAILEDYVKGRFLSGLIHDGMFYNKTTHLGEKIAATVKV